MQGRQKLKVEWDPGEHASFASEAYKQSLIETARQPQKVVRHVGDVDAVFARASQMHEAEYYVPHLAHAPLEPPAAVAEYKDGKVVIWAATQNPQAVQATVASVLGIGKQDVICHVTLLGGGFGRKSKPDYVAEAAILSKKVGKPVKVVWSRADDIHFDYYHTVAAMYMQAATDAQGRPTAWLQRSVFPPIRSTFDAAARYGGDGEMAQGWVDLPFDIPNLRAENGPAQSHVRIGWLRPALAQAIWPYGRHGTRDPGSASYRTCPPAEPHTARGEADVPNAPPVQRQPLQREGDPLRHRLIGFQDHCQIAEALDTGHLRLLARPDAVPERLDHRDQPAGVAGTLPGLFCTALLQSEPGCPQLERERPRVPETATQGGEGRWALVHAWWITPTTPLAPRVMTTTPSSPSCWARAWGSAAA